jgi:hypothetical protein
MPNVDNHHFANIICKTFLLKVALFQSQLFVNLFITLKHIPVLSQSIKFWANKRSMNLVISFGNQSLRTSFFAIRASAAT